MTDSIYRAAHDPSLETRRRVSKAIITQLDVLKPKSESYFLPARASEDGQKSDPPSIEPLAILHTGCFGESVLTGRRRPNKEDGGLRLRNKGGARRLLNSRVGARRRRSRAGARRRRWLRSGRRAGRRAAAAARRCPRG